MTRGWRPSSRRRRWRRQPFLAVSLAFIVVLAGAAGTLAVLPQFVHPSSSPDPVGVASASSVPSRPVVPSAATPTQAPASPTPATATPVPSPSARPTAPSASPSPSPAQAGPQLGPAAGQPVDRALAAKLQRALDTIRKKLGAPGIQATVVLPDGRTWTGVDGLAVVKGSKAVTPTTPFVFASVTKTFTAALICRLAEEGHLRLDDKLSRWLPQIPGARNISLRQLLDHQSGLADFFENTTLNHALQRNPKRPWAPREILKYLPPAWFPPGGGWGYSNTNYLLLGLVAEQAGGAPWATQIHREFLVPLGLDSIYVQGVDAPTAQPAHAYLVGVGSGGRLTYHDFSDGTGVIPFTSVTTATFSAGSLAGTSADLARWGALLYSGKVLSPKMTAQMLKMAKLMNRTPSLSYGATVYYGLGVSRLKLLGKWTVVGHTGALDGTRASIRWLPKEHIGIAAFYNRDGVFLTGDLVADALLPILVPTTPAPSPSPSR